MSKDSSSNGISPAVTTDFYYQIPDYPEAYTEGTVAARVVDGLGFRFYWASEGLSLTDLDFSVGNEIRTISETIDHILSLSMMLVDAVLSRVNSRQDWSHLTDEEKREQALSNFKQAADLLKANENNMPSYLVIFERSGGTFEYPFWNMLNGPIADAIYHVGQIVLLRRLLGNPINPGVNVFIGKKRDGR